jgi:YbbR domain-containing protein
VRQRSQTIGTLGRSPARQSGPMPTSPSPAEPPPPERGAVSRWIHSALFDNIGLKFLSFVLAVTVFLLVNTDKDRETTMPAGVKYNYPADKVLTSERLAKIDVTLKGPSRRLRSLHELDLDPVELDLHTGLSGEVPITPDLVKNLPPGITVISISPSTVKVAFDKRVEKVVEVVPAIAGRPQHGYVVAAIKTSPPTIKVRGGEHDLAKLTSIKTADVSLDGRIESFEDLYELAAPEGVTFDPTQRISVNVRIEEELVTRKLPDLVVTVRGDGVDPMKWMIAPTHVDVTLTGSRLAVEKTKDSMTPIVKLTAADTKPREVEVTIDGLPPGVGVRISPERVKVTPVRPEKPAPSP